MRPPWRRAKRGPFGVRGVSMGQDRFGVVRVLDVPSIAERTTRLGRLPVAR